MNKLSEARLGLRTFLEAFSFIRKHGLTWLFLLPVVIWLAIAGILVMLGVELIPELKAYMDGVLVPQEVPVRDGLIGYWDQIRNFFLDSTGLIVGFLASALSLFLGVFTIKYVVLIILSPVMAYASERTEQILTGQDFPFNWGQFFKDTFRGILIAVRNGAIEISISIVLGVATLFIPFMVPVSAVLLFLVSSYFYGFSTFDYVNERHRVGVSERIRSIRAKRWCAIGNGAAFNLLMKVPILGMVVAPILASVGACLVLVEKSPKSGTPRID